ncbi:MAG TPA: dihydroorotate dehydrogenase [Dehalococcoidia bacterium]|nr:dihydroorotate dehydrogenase [Dehalococcoidia bacterium]
MNLAIELAPRRKQGLPLLNPVMTASGTLSNGLEATRIFDVNRLGAIVSKGTTLRPRAGNPQPRTAETASGMLNTIGLQNVGVEALVRDVAPVWATWRVPVVVNIAGESVDEFAALASRLDGVPGVSGIEVNVSCPNVAVGGMLFGQDPKQAAAVTTAVVRATTLPVIVKLTPNVTDIVTVARAVVDAGADALCVINTLQAMAIDIRARRPVLSTVFGGLSGPAIKPVALRAVYQVAGAVDAPIIGCGGVSSGEDAIEFIMAGATAVQVGTATFTNPRAPLDVLEGIERFMADAGVSDVRELIGVARIVR